MNRGDLVGVGVADKGIPDIECEVIETGTETPVRHTNSIGRWIVDWSVAASGGSIDLSPNQPRGSVLTETASAERSGSRGPAE